MTSGKVIEGTMEPFPSGKYEASVKLLANNFLAEYDVGQWN